jgi:hypothetical protein
MREYYSNLRTSLCRETDDYLDRENVDSLAEDESCVESGRRHT